MESGVNVVSVRIEYTNARNRRSQGLLKDLARPFTNEVMSIPLLFIKMQEYKSQKMTDVERSVNGNAAGSSRYCQM